MKASHYIKRVKESEPIKALLKEDPKAYPCSLFFIRDFNENHDETHVDFYSPKKKEIFSFKINKKIERIPNKKMGVAANKKFVPKPLNEKIKMDIDEMRSTLMDEMHNREMTYEIEKILAFLNMVDEKPVWTCTGFLRGLGLLQAHIDDESASVLFMEKKSLFDMIRFTGNTLLGPGDSEQQKIKTPNIKILNPEIQGLESQKSIDADKIKGKTKQAKK